MDSRIVDDLKKHFSGNIQSGYEAERSLQNGLWNGLDEV